MQPQAIIQGIQAPTVKRETKSRASEILNKKRKLSLDMIRQLHNKLNIPTDVLIQSY